jgi:hypothetical protein
MAVGIEEARAAKGEAAELASKAAKVVGVGLVGREGSYGLKINLAAPPSSPLPDRVQGVPVTYEVVGAIVPRQDG